MRSFYEKMTESESLAAETLCLGKGLLPNKSLLDQMGRIRGNFFQEERSRDDEALPNAILSLEKDREKAKAMGEAARAYVVEHFHREQQAKEFVALLMTLAEPRRKEFSTAKHAETAEKRHLDRINSIYMIKRKVRGFKKNRSDGSVSRIWQCPGASQAD